MSVTRTLRERLAEIEAHGLAIAGVKFGKHVKIDISAADEWRAPCLIALFHRQKRS